MAPPNENQIISNQTARRYELQSLLESILGTRNVFFQPPENFKLKYPAIVYQLNTIRSRYADDLSYSRHRSYQVTVIDQNPDTDIPDSIGALPRSSFVQYFASDQLNHYIYTLYF